MFNSNSGNKNIVTGFFGKLPGFPDFIKHNSAGKEILSIDAWIQEGLALAKTKIKNEWKNYYNNLPKMNFIYPHTGTENFLIGSLLPSSDKSGRSYPFILFSQFNKNLLNEFSNFLIPYALKDIYLKFNNTIDENIQTDDTTNIREGINNLTMQNLIPPHIASDYRNFLSSTELSNIFSSDKINEFSLTGLFEKNIKLFEHFISVSYKRNLNQKDDAIIICFCIQLLEKIFNNINSIPSVLWFNADEESGIFLLSFTKPTAKDFIDLLLSNNSADLYNENNEIENRTAKFLIQDNTTIDNKINLNEFLVLVESHLNQIKQ